MIFPSQPVALGGELAALRRGEKDGNACRLAAQKLVLLRHRAVSACTSAGVAGAAASAPEGAEACADGAAHMQLLRSRLEQLLPRVRPHVTFAPLPNDGMDTG